MTTALLPPPLDALPDDRRRHLIRGALHFWQQGDTEIRAPHRVTQRTRYERAVARVLRAMQPFSTMELLLAQYYVDRSALIRLTERACRDADAPRPLSRIWVRDAAFWRHLRTQLPAASVDIP